MPPRGAHEAESPEWTASIEESQMRYWRKPLDLDQLKVPRGDVRIIDERCKGCGFCVEYCPKDVLELSEEFNSKGYHPPKVVKSGECVNCNLCEMICPDFAIYSVALPDGNGVEAYESMPQNGAAESQLARQPGGITS
jgi:2-oxoglutarate ferredoxin oxidoreductase subunit delta